jgi:pyroglutamyl-peptidase
MNAPPRILITGFGPFPGAPSNPTMRIAERLGRLRRPRYSGLDRVVRILPTTWRMLGAMERPVIDLQLDAVLMFGLAGRRRRITPEERALNHAGPLRTDAEGASPPGRSLSRGGPFTRTGGIDAARMTAMLRRHGFPAAVSRDAGDYLCKARFYRVAALGVPCIFVHVPRPVRPTSQRGGIKRPRPTMAGLHRAAEIALDQVLLRIRH